MTDLCFVAPLAVHWSQSVKWRDYTMTDHPAFIPVLTVMVDYGLAPFMWLKETPDEIGYVNDCICDGRGWYDRHSAPDFAIFSA